MWQQIAASKVTPTSAGRSPKQQSVSMPLTRFSPGEVTPDYFRFVCPTGSFDCEADSVGCDRCQSSAHRLSSSFLSA